MATIADVAQRAGVGVSTAARALSGHGYVAPATRERVLETANELGYVANRVARSLRTRSTRMLGLLVADVENPFYSVIAKNVESVAKEAGYHVILCNDNDEAAEEREYLTILEGMGIEGLIITPTSRNRRDLERLGQKGMAIVQIDRQVKGLRTDAILADNEGGARAAVDHLVAKGHTRIGILAGPGDVTTGRLRLDGFLAAMAAHGLEVPADRIRSCSFRRDHAVQEARALLEGPDRPTAVFATNNILAESVLLAVEELGLRVPGDVSLVAFDDMPWMSMTSPKITAIRQPVADMARTATDLILRRLRHDVDEASTLVFQPQLIERGSVASLHRRAKARADRLTVAIESDGGPAPAPAGAER